MHRFLVALFMASTPTAGSANEQNTPVTFDAAMTAALRNAKLVNGGQAVELLTRASQKSPPVDANPIVTVAAGGRLTPSTEQGFEGGLSLTQSIAVEGAAGLRRDALAGEAAWIRAETDAETMARQLAVASAWLVLQEAEGQVAAATEDVANEARFVTLLTRLASAGERTAADVSTGQVRLTESELRERLAEGMLADARAQLASEIGPPTSGVFVTQGPAPALSNRSFPDAATIDRLAAELPPIRARQLLAKSETLRAAEERAMRGMHVQVGIEARRDALSATVLQGTLGVPLPFFAVGDREFAAKRAAALRAEGDALDETTRARAMLTLAVHEVEHSEEVFQTLSTRLVPETVRALTQRELQLTSGEGTLLEVLDARRSQVDARSRLVRATRDRIWARLRLLLLIQAAGGTS